MHCRSEFNHLNASIIILHINNKKISGKYIMVKIGSNVQKIGNLKSLQGGVFYHQSRDNAVQIITSGNSTGHSNEMKEG